MKRVLPALGLLIVVVLICWWVLGAPAVRQPPPEFARLTWAKLSGFEYKEKKPLPADIPALNGLEVNLDGFMLPVNFQGREVRTFILSRDQNACCFGIMPAFNQWIFVRMAPDRRAQVDMDRLITVWGVLEVGEEIKDGTVTSLYRLVCQGVTSQTSP